MRGAVYSNKPPGKGSWCFCPLYKYNYIIQRPDKASFLVVATFYITDNDALFRSCWKSTNLPANMLAS